MKAKDKMQDIEYEASEEIRQLFSEMFTGTRYKDKPLVILKGMALEDLANINIGKSLWLDKERNNGGGVK